MRTNVDKVLERDEKLSHLDDRADALQHGASQFETQATRLKRKYWWKNCKVYYLLFRYYEIESSRTIGDLSTKTLAKPQENLSRVNGILGATCVHAYIKVVNTAGTVQGAAKNKTCGGKLMA